MFRLSKGSEYAIAGLIYMASRPSAASTGIEEISRATGISRQYLAKLFQALVARGLVSSFRGRDGGFMFAREPRSITLLDVVEAIDGPIEGKIEKKGQGEAAKPFPIYDVVKQCAFKITEVLSAYTIDRIKLNFFVPKKDKTDPI